MTAFEERISPIWLDCGSFNCGGPSTVASTGNLGLGFRTMIAGGVSCSSLNFGGVPRLAGIVLRSPPDPPPRGGLSPTGIGTYDSSELRVRGCTIVWWPPTHIPDAISTTTAACDANDSRKLRGSAGMILNSFGVND